MAEEQATAEKPAAKPAKKAKVLKFVTNVNLVDWSGTVRYKAGEPHEIDRISGWHQSQVDAGLASIIEE